jgi:NAD(P)-dependent dehydrogenase (short-subunit alcohol dehydrogenase family)
MRLEGKKALITGAGSYGIGRAIALGFAREGADVAIHYRSRPEVAASVVADIEALGRRSFMLQADLAAALAMRLPRVGRLYWRKALSTVDVPRATERATSMIVAPAW